MRKHPKQILPLIYAIESFEDVLSHLTKVSEGVLEDIDNGETPALMESDHQHLKSAENWTQTAMKYLKEFQGNFKE